MGGPARRRIGFLGTGIMGLPMARRLAEAGHEVRAWNRTRDKAERLAAAGAEVVPSPPAAVRDAEVVVCMLSSGPVCDEVLLGDGAALAAMPPSSILVVTSSIPVHTARRQARAAAARTLGYLDAPVSGGETGAIDGTLAILVGGEAADLERVRPVLEVLGRPTHIGPAGTGQLAKLANQLIVAGTLTVVAEALLLAERGGADPAAVRAALLGGFARSTVLEQHGARMIRTDFRPGGPAKHQLKDTTTAVALARELHLELPVAALVDRLFADLVEQGDGDLDHSAVIRQLRRHNGLSVS
ncbi:MAG TPA: NAD(P)-dependent oxidoreductase [Actinoplanes sp.]|nr:NAD(P)-dependent oxidoreductase [Actinoplanes sp.]